MVGGGWRGYWARSRGKSTKRFRSCGDLTIYPIREIRGNNRIIYGDQYDDDDRENQTKTDKLYFVRSDEFHHENLIPTGGGGEYSEINEPFYCEIQQTEQARYEKLYHFSSHPSINTIHSGGGGASDSDSGYRSVSHQVILSLLHSSIRGLEKWLSIAVSMLWLHLNNDKYQSSIRGRSLLGSTHHNDRHIF